MRHATLEDPADGPEDLREPEVRRGGFGGMKLGTLAGVEVRVDWSLLVIFALVAMSLGAQMLPSWHPDWSAGLSWGVAIVAAVLFFASVFAHEMSHALVGRAQGIPIRRITLFLFGGVAHMESEPPSPRSEILMAAVGPVVSIAIGVGSILIGSALVSAEIGELLLTTPELGLARLSPLATVLFWLGPINIALGVFNLVPGFPLDGGRVFRAIAWWITGDMLRATRWASLAGRGLAMLLMAMGAAMALGVWIPFFGTGLAAGVWLLLIGWFLNKAAQASFDQLRIRDALEGVTVDQIMRSRGRVVASHDSVETLIQECIMQSDQDAFAVVDEGHLVGIVTSRAAMRLAPGAWASTPIREIMIAAERVPTLAPGEDVGRALRVLERQRMPMLPVVQGDSYRGSLHGRDVFKWLVLHVDERGGGLAS